MGMPASDATTAPQISTQLREISVVNFDQRIRPASADFRRYAGALHHVSLTRDRAESSDIEGRTVFSVVLLVRLRDVLRERAARLRPNEHRPNDHMPNEHIDATTCRSAGWKGWRIGRRQGEIARIRADDAAVVGQTNGHPGMEAAPA